MLSNKEEIEDLKKKFEEKGYKFIPVSLVTKEGIDELLNEIRNISKSLKEQPVL